MDLTGNYKLKKPGQNDAYNIQNENDNMDILDKEIEALNNKFNDINLDAANVSFTSSITEFTQKNVKLALDYLFQLANNGKKYWVDVVGIPLLITDTFATLKAKTQTIKNTIAANIVSKGVSANGSETLNSLADDISKITITTMGGYKLISGITTIGYIDATSVPSVSSVFICYIKIPELSGYNKIIMFKADGTLNYDGTVTSGSGTEPFKGTLNVNCAHITLGKMHGTTANLGVLEGDSLCSQEGSPLYPGDNCAFNFDINKILVKRFKPGGSTYAFTNPTNVSIQWYALVQ